MIESLICVIFLIVVRLTVNWLSGTFAFLNDWILYINIGIVLFTAVTVVLAIVKIIKAINKK